MWTFTTHHEHALTRIRYKIVCAGPEEKVVGLHILGDSSGEMLQVGSSIELSMIDADWSKGVWCCNQDGRYEEGFRQLCGYTSHECRRDCHDEMIELLISEVEYQSNKDALNSCQKYPTYVQDFPILLSSRVTSLRSTNVPSCRFFVEIV
jgi:hypothetical protein